jgi:hypothetical protein
VVAFAETMTARTGDRDLEAWLTAVEATFPLTVQQQKVPRVS